SNVLGTINPVHELVALAQDVGALTLLSSSPGGSPSSRASQARSLHSASEASGSSGALGPSRSPTRYRTGTIGRPAARAVDTASTKTGCASIHRASSR
ncbi:hypothetical protein FJV46_15105, partial [Arthrobacter agilis]